MASCLGEGAFHLVEEPPVWSEGLLFELGLPVWAGASHLNEASCLEFGPPVWAGPPVWTERPSSGLGPPVWDRAFCLGWELPVYAGASCILSFRFFSLLKLSLSLSRYRSDRFGYRVIVIEVADLDKRYRIIVIEVGVKLSSAH